VLGRRKDLARSIRIDVAYFLLLPFPHPPSPPSSSRLLDVPLSRPVIPASTSSSSSCSSSCIPLSAIRLLVLSRCSEKTGWSRSEERETRGK
jgi:hypothetical protein